MKEVRWTHYPVMVTVRDNYRNILGSSYTPITEGVGAGREVRLRRKGPSAPRGFPEIS